MKNQILKIERMGSDGEGIAYYNKKPVFIYYALLGETINADIYVNKRGTLEANINEIIEKSSDRVDVTWKHYLESGSVNLLHYNYFSQLNYKRNVINFLLSSKLRKVTNNTKLERTIKSEDELGYRNKTDIPLIYENGKNHLANYFRGSNNLFKVTDLIIENEYIIKALKDIINILNETNYKAFNPRTKKGEIYSLSVRSNLEGKVQLMINTKRTLNLNSFVNKLNQANKDIVSIYQNTILRYSNNTDVYNGKLELVSGSKYLEMKLKDLKFYLTPFAFFQLNTKQAIVLYEEVIKLANFKKSDIVLDAYSGVGTIASFISPHVKEVVAIESIKDAVNDMEYSLDKNNIKNVKTITGDLVKMTNYLKSKHKFDKVIFDPPRVGLGDKVCKYLLSSLPKSIIYVSCNPKTLVKDLEMLSLKYDIKSITPIDMFPQTSQIESITILERK